MAFGKNLKTVREILKLSQTDVANRIGVDQYVISRIESKDQDHSKYAHKISDALNINHDLLFRELPDNLTIDDILNINKDDLVSKGQAVTKALQNTALKSVALPVYSLIDLTKSLEGSPKLSNPREFKKLLMFNSEQLELYPSVDITNPDESVILITPDVYAKAGRLIGSNRLVVDSKIDLMPRDIVLCKLSNGSFDLKIFELITGDKYRLVNLLPGSGYDDFDDANRSNVYGVVITKFAMTSVRDQAFV